MASVVSCSTAAPDSHVSIPIIRPILTPTLVNIPGDFCKSHSKQCLASEGKSRLSIWGAQRYPYFPTPQQFYISGASVNIHTHHSASSPGSDFIFDNTVRLGDRSNSGVMPVLFETILLNGKRDFNKYHSSYKGSD